MAWLTLFAVGDKVERCPKLKVIDVTGTLAEVRVYESFSPGNTDQSRLSAEHITASRFRTYSTTSLFEEECGVHEARKCLGFGVGTWFAQQLRRKLTDLANGVSFQSNWALVLMHSCLSCSCHNRAET